MHIELTAAYKPKTISFKNETVSFTLRRFTADERARYNITSSHDIEFLGKKIYVQLNRAKDNIGFWLDNNNKFENKTIIRLPIVNFETIDLVIFIES